MVWRVPGREGVDKAGGCGGARRGVVGGGGSGEGWCGAVGRVWQRAGIRAAEAVVLGCWNRQHQRRRGRGLRLTLLSVEEKVSGEKCEGEQPWACFYAGS